MARIEPFKGVRPKKDIVEKVASPPYDVLNSKDAKEYAAGNPYSFLHIVKPEIDLPDGTDLYSDEVYGQAAKNFKTFRDEGTLIQDEKKKFYIYKQIWHDHVQVGLVAGASCQDYQDDIIKKHELTREDKENDRMRHIKTLNANTGPVFLTFKHNDEIDALFDKGMKVDPVYDFTSEDVRHIFYLVEDGNLIGQIKAAFEKVDYLYVADGHHRSASGTRVKKERQEANANHTGDEEYNFFLSVIFPDNQMKILAYNRVVKDLNGLSDEDFMKAVAKSFDIEETELKAPEGTQQFCMYMNGKWHLLKAKAGSFNAGHPVESLDASIMQANLLDPVLGIKNPRKDKRVDFVGGIRGTGELEKLVDGGNFKVAFSLFPTTIEQLFGVADSGNIMPPKSTWFEPKLKSGMVTHLLED
jgi:uncharacterized protein (DUF1015 family)